MAKRFSELVAAIPAGVIAVSGDAEISAPVVESDAEVQTGGVFVARKGLSVDGHQFIPRAIERGAAAIVGEIEMTELSVPYAQVENAQEAVGYLAAAYHDFPSRKMIVIGVTGTDGKTTTSTFIHSILQVATNNRAGLISTVAAVIGDKQIDTGFHVTTPSAPQIQALLAQMVENGFTHAVLEMTSHGLAQGRLNGVDIDVAVLTNITHEHLDYHGTFEAYRDAKARIFALTARHKPNSIYKSVPFAMINGDDVGSRHFSHSWLQETYDLYSWQYSLDSLSYARFIAARETIQYEPHRTTFRVKIHRSFGNLALGTFTTSLIGEFNIYNALAAIGVCMKLWIPNDVAPDNTKALETVRQGIAAVQSIPGRLERIDEGQKFIAIVDFAHTPNALKNALEAVRPMVGEGGKLITLIGSAGLRDREKRKLMAETAIKLADFTILTAEDPRTESLDDILQTMADAAKEAGGVEGKDFIRVRDRGEALYRACQMAHAGDVVIACGKGHEQSMAFGTVEYPWDDREAMRAAIRGTPLKTLPTAKPEEN